MKEVERPTPHERTGRGLPAYNALELGAYRKAMRVPVEELAQHLGFTRTYISHMEMARYSPLDAKRGDKLLAGVEDIVLMRLKLEEEGVRDLAAIRGGKAPRVSRPLKSPKS